MGRIFPDCGCGCDGIIQEKKFVLAFIYTLFFIFFASPMSCQAINKLFGVSGYKALILQSIFFMFAVWATLNFKNEFMVGAINPFPLAQSGGSVINTIELPDVSDSGQPWADPNSKSKVPSEKSMMQPWAEGYTLSEGPAPPKPPFTQGLLPSPIIPAIFSTSSKNTVGFEDVDQHGGIIYAVI